MSSRSARCTKQTSATGARYAPRFMDDQRDEQPPEVDEGRVAKPSRVEAASATAWVIRARQLREPALRNACVLTFGFFVFAWRIAARLLDDFQQGGDRWRQADWLVNGAVRRGAFGDVVLWVADAADVAPVSLVILAQAVLLGGFLLASYVAVARLRFPSRLTLLALSPLFVGFWAWDTAGVGRKEILVYGAMGVLLAAPRSWAALLFSGALFSVAAFAHEAMLLFWPLFVAALWVCHRRGAPRWAVLCASLGSLGLSLVALVSASAFYGHGQPSQICAPLLARGAPRTLCGGAIFFAGDSLAEAVAFTARSARRGWPFTYVAYAAGSLGTFAALWPTRASTRSAALVVGAGALFAPLWWVAVDWGRWLNFHATSITVLLMLSAQREGEGARELRPSAFWLALCVGLTWMVPHYVEAAPRWGPLGDAAAVFVARLFRL